MLARMLAVAMNAYREAVRARVLYGLFALALATCAYAVVVASLSLDQQPRVVSDIGAGSISLYAALVAIVLGATSLHRELELKTVFPILARPLRRHEYLLGKYMGTIATLVVFVATDAAAVLAVLALEANQKPALVAGAVVLLLAILGVLLLRAKYTRVFVLIPWSLAAFAAMAILASPAGQNRGLVIASAALTLCEASIVAAIATLFSSFSSPFLTAVFTLGVFLVGRSADTLAHLPARQFGEGTKKLAAAISHVVPNLHVYVPPRPLLLGQVPDVPVWAFVGRAGAQALGYSAVMLAIAALFFRKRDFT